MDNYYLENLKKGLGEKQTLESFHNLIENTDFFFKVLKVKFESKDPELLKQAVDELKALRSILDSN